MRAKLLYVEDHADTAELFSILLGLKGFEIVTAETVADAKAAAAASDVFDLVVCDIGLPDGDGCTLMNYLRSKYGLEGIAVTASKSPEDVQRCADAGFMRHLLKPVAYIQVERAIFDALALCRLRILPEILRDDQLNSMHRGDLH